MEGAYTKKEWTSIYDIGKLYSGNEFTSDDYLEIEKSYIDTILMFMNGQGIHQLTIRGLEYHEDIENFRELYTEGMIELYNSIKNNSTLNVNLKLKHL